MPVVRELISRFGFKVDKKQFDKAEQGFKNLKTAATAIVGVLVAGRVAKAIQGTVAEVARAADTFDKMSKRVGISTEVLQEYEFVAGLAGTTLGEFEIAIRRLQYSLVEASDGTKEYADEFKKLGIRTKDANGQLKSAEDLLPELADGMRRLKTDTERTAIAQKLLGRGGTSLIPVLMQGTDAIMEQRKEARELGFIDEELVGLGVDWIDTQLRMRKAIDVAKNAIARALLPGMIKTGKALVEWIKANKEWLRQKVGRAIRQLAEFAGRLARVVFRAARGFYEWARSLDPLSARLLKIGAVAAGLAVILMLPAGPLLLLIGLILLIIDDLEVMGEGGKSVSGDLIKAFQEWYDRTGGMINLLVDLWKWGWSVMLESAKAIFLPLHEWMTAKVQAIIDWMVTAFKRGVAKITRILEETPIVGRVVAGIKAVAGAAGAMTGGAAPVEAALMALGGPGVARGRGAGGSAQIINAPRTNISVEVQARTGATAEEIGSAVGQQIDEAMDRRNREALAGLTQGVAPLVPGT